MTTSPKNRAGRPAKVSRQQIIDAAILAIREHGLDFSMRSLCRELGVAQTSIYHNVGNKADVIEAVGNQLLAELRFEDITGKDWQEKLENWMNAFRDRLLAGPELLTVLPKVARSAAWLRALRSVVLVLEDLGMPEPQQALYAQSISWEVIGFALFEQSMRALKLDEQAALQDAELASLPALRHFALDDTEALWSVTVERTLLGIENRSRR